MDSGRIHCHKQTSTSLGITLIKQEWNVFTYLPEDSIATEAKSKRSRIFPAYAPLATLSLDFLPHYYIFKYVQ